MNRYTLAFAGADFTFGYVVRTLRAVPSPGRGDREMDVRVEVMSGLMRNGRIVGCRRRRKGRSAFRELLG